MPSIFYINTGSVETIIVSSSMVATPTATIDLSAASYVSGSFQGSGINLTQITASYIAPDSTTSASYALSASYAPSEAGTALTTGSQYPITASHALNADNAVSSSYALDALSASYAPSEPASALTTGSTYPITSSWAELATSASHALVADNAGTTLTTGSQYPITASHALNADNTISSSHALVADNAGTTLTTGSLYPITASHALNSDSTISSSYALSASYAPSEAGTALTTGSLYPITASWAITSSNAVSASWAPGGSGVTDGGSYNISASFASSSLSASWVAPVNTFSRGGSFVDWGGIGGSSAANQVFPVWRAPFNCSATALYATHDGVGSLATVNARKNFTSLLLTGSAPSNSGSWAGYTSLQNNSFVAGDTLEVNLVSSSNEPIVVSIQVDFTR